MMVQIRDMFYLGCNLCSFFLQCLVKGSFLYSPPKISPVEMRNVLDGSGTPTAGNQATQKCINHKNSLNVTRRYSLLRRTTCWASAFDCGFFALQKIHSGSLHGGAGNSG